MTLDAAVNDVLDERIAHPTASADLLNVLFGADNGTWPRKRIRDEALTFMLAGHETTANAMSWLWYLLARTPDARDKMLAEIDDVLGGRRPDRRRLDRAAVDDGCVQESQRYYSAVWMIGREAVEDDDIDGHHIRQGTTVLVPVHAIHHDERWWPDPETFDPTRFLGDAGQGPPPLGVSAVRRRTADLHRAELRTDGDGADGGDHESAVHLRPVPDHPVELEATLTLRPKHGVQVVAHERESRGR